MAVHAAFAKELAAPQDCYHSLLIMLGRDGEFDLALLNVIDRVGNVALHEFVFILSNLRMVLPTPTLARKI